MVRCPRAHRGLPGLGAAASPVATPHPAPALEDVGARLGRLIVGHAEVDRLDRQRLDDRRLLFTRAEEGLAAQIETPGGPKWLR